MGRARSPDTPFAQCRRNKKLEWKSFFGLIVSVDLLTKSNVVLNDLLRLLTVFFRAAGGGWVLQGDAKCLRCKITLGVVLY